MAGRKSLKDELKVMERYADLSESYFKVLKKALESESKEDQRWAADNLKGAFAKMIPQDINADLGGTLLIQWQSQQSLQSHMNPENGSSGFTIPVNAGLSSSSTAEPEKPQQSSTTSNETHS